MKKFFLAITFMVVTALICPMDSQAQKDSRSSVARQRISDQSLFFALAKGDMTSMEVLAAKGANPNATLASLGLTVNEVFGADLSAMLPAGETLSFNPRGWPILHWAVYLDKLDAAKMLVRFGARVNSPDIYGATALHWAAWGGRHEIAKVLLNNRGNCVAKDRKGRTPMDWATMMSQTDIIVLLEGRICKPADSDRDGVTDDIDLCPNTPLGAPVDERGCWVVAYAGFFDFNKSAVKSQYIPNIIEAAQVLKTHKSVTVNLQGYTDSVGSVNYNQGLGMRRAEAVYSILVANGVEPGRVVMTSKGESDPIASNSTPKGRSRNRRVEIHVQ